MSEKRINFPDYKKWSLEILGKKVIEIKRL